MIKKVSRQESIKIIELAFQLTLNSFLQVAIFIFLYEAVVEYYVARYGPMNKLFGFGMQLNASTYLLSILVGLNSMAQLFIRHRLGKVAAVFGTAIVWLYFWANIADVTPNRFALISILGLFSLSLGILLFARRPNESVHSTRIYEGF